MVSFLPVHDIVSGLDGLYENDALHLCQVNDDAPENNYWVSFLLAKG